MGIEHENNGGLAGSVTRLHRGMLNGNRLGFKGMEDLGGGMSVIFVLENGFDADTGALGQGGLLFGREAWGGMSGSFGSIKFGRQKSVVLANAAVFDPFGDALAGDSGRLFNYSGYRTNNMITYGYEARGLRGQLQYGLGEVAGNLSASRTIAGFGGYKRGPIDILLTHHRTSDSVGNVTGKATLIGGNVNFGVIKAFVAHAWNKDVKQNGTISPGTDIRNGLIGVKVPIGAADTVIVSYIRLWNKTIRGAGARQIAIGYVHNLSNRTALYTSYSRLRNEHNAKYLVPAEGLTAQLFNAGIRHQF